MCGGFPCNCCKPRLSIDTHFDDMTVPWKCFFRNKNADGTNGTTIQNYDRRITTVRPILDWPCEDSLLKIPEWTEATPTPSRFRWLMLTMKHPFDVEAGETPEGSYSCEVIVEPPAGRTFQSFTVDIHEEREADNAFYGATSTLKSILNFSVSIERSFAGVWTSILTNGEFAIRGDGRWVNQNITSPGTSTEPHTIKIEWQKTSDRYKVYIYINNVLIPQFAIDTMLFPANPNIGGGDPLLAQDFAQWMVITSPAFRVPKPWKNYRLSFLSSSFTAAFSIPNHPLMMDRIKVSATP